MRTSLIAVCCLTCSLFATAQQDLPTATTGTITVSAKLVVVPAVVRDKRGALVNTLTKDDFSLKVDGKQQSLRYFDHENDTPLTIGLLVDTSRSQSAVLDNERTASTKFLQSLLQPATANRASDKAFVMQFARDVELLQDVTDSRPKLQEALKLVDSESPSFRRTPDDNSNGTDSSSGDRNNDRDRRGGYGRGGGGGGTALYDSVFLASDEVISKQKGRRAVILLTDGVDRGSKKTLAASIESAQRADAILYAIYFKGEQHHDGGFGGPGGGGGHRGGGFPGGFPGGGGGGYPGGGGGQRRGGGEENVDGKKILDRMCGETGGRLFEVKGKQTVEAIYNEIGEELRAQYRLGFSPSSDATAEGYHQVELDLQGAQAKNKLTVQTRDGYYTGPQ